MEVGGMEVDVGETVSAGSAPGSTASRHLPQRCRHHPACGQSAAGAAGGWQLERRRFFSEATMAKIHEPEEAFALTERAPAEQVATTISRNAPVFA